MATLESLDWVVVGGYFLILVAIVLAVNYIARWGGGLSPTARALARAR